MLESSIISVEEFFIDKSNQEWRPLSSHTLEQSPCYPIIDKREYNNNYGNGTFYYCKLHPDLTDLWEHASIILPIPKVLFKPSD